MQDGSLKQADEVLKETCCILNSEALMLDA